MISSALARLPLVHRSKFDRENARLPNGLAESGGVMFRQNEGCANSRGGGTMVARVVSHARTFHSIRRRLR